MSYFENLTVYRKMLRWFWWPGVVCRSWITWCFLLCLFFKERKNYVKRQNMLRKRNNWYVSIVDHSNLKCNCVNACVNIAIQSEFCLGVMYPTTFASMCPILQCAYHSKFGGKDIRIYLTTHYTYNTSWFIYSLISDIWYYAWIT